MLGKGGEPHLESVGRVCNVQLSNIYEMKPESKRLQPDEQGEILLGHVDPRIYDSVSVDGFKFRFENDWNTISTVKTLTAKEATGEQFTLPCVLDSKQVIN